MRDHLKEVFKERLATNTEKNFKLSTISPFNVRRILRVHLDYTWRKWKQRAPKWTGNLSDKRKLFANLIKKLESIGFNTIYVDEASVCQQNITLYSWWHKQKPDPIIRSSTRINMIAAMILPHKYSFMLKTGATKSEHMITFYELLHSKLWDYFREEYISILLSYSIMPPCMYVIVVEPISSGRCFLYLHYHLRLLNKIMSSRHSSG